MIFRVKEESLSSKNVHSACICSMLNAYYHVRLGKSNDLPWDSVPVFITSFVCGTSNSIWTLICFRVVEANVGIIYGCIPVSAAIFRHPNMKSSCFASLCSGPFYRRSKSVFFKLPHELSRGTSSSLVYLNRVGSQPSTNVQMESRHSVSTQGGGRLTETRDSPQHQWLDFTANLLPTY